MTTPHNVLFVCVRNSGKSQLAAAIARHQAGDRIVVHSAGTDPGTELNPLSVASLSELGIGVGSEHPKPVTAELIDQADLVVVLGTEATVDTGATPQQTWDTDEPSHRHIDGIDRMRLIRDDIARRVVALLQPATGAREPDGPTAHDLDAG